MEEEVKKERRRGRLPKSPIVEGQNLTQAQIAQRYRDRKKAAGLEFSSFWIPAELVTKIRNLAEKDGENTSEVLERILRKFFK